MQLILRFLQRSIFSDVAPLIHLGKQRPLRPEDMPAINNDLDPLQIEDAFHTLDTSKPGRFVWQSFWATGSTAYLTIAMSLLRIPLALAAPVILKNLLESLQQTPPNTLSTVHSFANILALSSVPSHIWTDTLTKQFLLGITLAAVVVTEGIIIQHFFYYALRTWSRISNGINMRVYRRTLALSNYGLAQTQTGDLVNHIASDSDGVGEAAFFIPDIFSAILKLIATIFLLVSFLGWAAIAAISVMFFMMPLMKHTASRFTKYDSQLWKLRDTRITMMSQILTGIRVIKYFAWERSIEQEVQRIRTNEVTSYRHLVTSESVSTLLYLSTSTIVAFVCFGVYTILGGSLTISLIFPALLLFMQLEEPIGNASHWIRNLSHSRVAAERLNAFFKLEQTTKSTENGFVQKSHNDDISIHSTTTDMSNALELTNISVVYESSADSVSATTTALDNISLTIKHGESIAIVGEVGSGKTTLLLSILGETRLLHGTISFAQTPNSPESHNRPRIGYVSQEPFILNATIRENIIYGHDDETMLEACIDSCALRFDINQMPAGINTEIGERGITLSGGQKMRLTLARAALYNPDILLLDDPLAAVDSTTEDYLVEKMLFGKWKSKTKIVTTHRLAHLEKFDQIVFLQNGRIVCKGTLSECQKISTDFDALITGHTKAQVEGSDVEDFLPIALETIKHTDDSGMLVEEEDKEVGLIRKGLFLEYFNALALNTRTDTLDDWTNSIEGNQNTSVPSTARYYRIRLWIGYTILGSTCLSTALLPMLQTGWLSWWSDAAKSNILPVSLQNYPMLAVAIYGCLGIIVLSANFFERITWMKRAITASQIMHDRTLRSILCAPLRFFDTTPMGRILNRFSRDLQSVDDELAWNVESTARSLAMMIATVFLITITAPLALVVAIPALLVYYRVQRDYRISAREAKRIESIARSPRFAHYKETISGLLAIRSYKQEEVFIATFVDKLRLFQQMLWGSIMLNRWFSTRSSLISGVIAATTIFVVIFMLSFGLLSLGIAALVITYSLTFWSNLNWCVRSFSEMESRMTSYERLSTYSAIASEQDVSSPASALASSDIWIDSSAPENTPFVPKANIVFENVSARYAPHLPFVLENVSLRIEHGQRIGIIGRTGSGKSTLFQALFRCITLEQGRIFIGGVDITRIPLQRLRKAIAVIPQDPILFIGTIRNNIDRFEQYTDDEVWSALRRVHIDEVVKTLGGLSTLVTENGSNFSQGQRQLLCLSRALLTKAKIIVMDEATASVDVQTDARIQQTIRTEFSSATVLIIAHRYNSIADADMIVDMSLGKATTRLRSQS